MRRPVAFVSIVALLMVGTAVLAGLEDDRFYGGSADGYANIRLLQTSSDLDLITARFKGGSYDGYGSRTAEDLFIPNIATVLLIR